MPRLGLEFRLSPHVVGACGDLESFLVGVPLPALYVLFDRSAIHLPQRLAEVLLPNAGDCTCGSRDDLPLMYCTTFAGARSGGTDNNLWSGSGEIAPRAITSSGASQIWRINSRTRSATRPRIPVYRYFVTRTTRYLLP